MGWRCVSIRLAQAAAILIVSVGSWSSVGAQTMKVSTDFEGGSASHVEIDSAARVISLTPGGEAKNGWICWWFVRIDQAEPRKPLTIEVNASTEPTRNQGKLTKQPLAAGWAMPSQASVSHDGVTWQRSVAAKREGNSIRYEVTPEQSSVWIAWGPPFTPRDTTELVAKATAKIAEAKEFKLARSREGRDVVGLRIASAIGESREAPAVWIQARQHAWESGSSWVARGVVEWLLTDDEPAKWLRQNAEIVVVPVMDVDNVATGNGGKEEDPRDHNRDWDEMPVYPEVLAAQQQLQKWSDAGRLDFFIDLHNPAPNDPKPFFFGGPPEFLSDLGRNNRALFLNVAQKRIDGPLPVEATPRITGPSYHPLWRKISGQWVTDHGNDHTMAICLETAWNTPQSTTDGYLTVGRQLGETIAEYLQRRKK